MTYYVISHLTHALDSVKCGGAQTIDRVNDFRSLIIVENAKLVKFLVNHLKTLHFVPTISQGLGTVNGRRDQTQLHFHEIFYYSASILCNFQL